MAPSERECLSRSERDGASGPRHDPQATLGERPLSPERRTSYLVRGKPRSTLEVPGSGQRAVTTLARV